MNDYEVYQVSNPLKNNIELYVSRALADGEREFLLANGDLRIVPRGADVKERDIIFAAVPLTLVKNLIDSLADQGIRSKSEETLAGELEATKYHLEDMRKIALKGKS